MDPEPQKKPQRTHRELRDERLPRGMTPRLLTKEEAAAYCNTGPETFEQRVGVAPFNGFGSKRRLYDRVALDLWLDNQSGLPAPGATTGVNWSERL
jgi:hypothetical protein